MGIDLDDLRARIVAGQSAEAYGEIESLGDAVQAAEAFHTVGKGLYWKDKDLALSRQTLESGIAFTQRQFPTNEEIMGKEKAMCYDLASFCWVGWDEPGIAIGEEDVNVGRWAAERNLALGTELCRPAGPMANAHFMVGGYRLTDGDLDGARESFAEFHRLADWSGDRGAAMLAEGYLALAALKAGEEGAAENLVEIQQRLEATDPDNGKFYADQLATARDVTMRS